MVLFLPFDLTLRKMLACVQANYFGFRIGVHDYFAFLMTKLGRKSQGTMARRFLKDS